MMKLYMLDLINNKTIKNIDKIFQKQSNSDISLHTDWNTNLKNIYINYIQPNMFPLILFVLIAIFLFIKYILKQENEKKHKKNKKKNIKDTNKNFKINYKDTEIIENQEPEIYDLKPAITEQYDENNIEHIDNYYNNLQDEENISDIMVHQCKQQDITKLSFNELARVIGGGNNNYY
jgi:hypothetical protein